jgi:hypothetical protein
LRQIEKKLKLNKKLNYWLKRHLSRRLIRLQNLLLKEMKLKELKQQRPSKQSTIGNWL